MNSRASRALDGHAADLPDALRSPSEAYDARRARTLTRRLARRRAGGARPTIVVPLLVVALGVAAIATITIRQQQAPLNELVALLDRAEQPGAASADALPAEAVRAYTERARRAERQAIVGVAAVIVLLLCAFGLGYRQNRRLIESSRHEALSDLLTGLGNRRALVSALADQLGRASAGRELLLGLFDLDGFKQYNDTFGHPAGDALLARLGERLRSELEGLAVAYRMGGDEFCLLATVDPGAAEPIMRRAAAALTESSDVFRISCSHGSALIPSEATTSREALHLADQRMYAQKARFASASRQSSDVLLRVLAERSGSLDAHVSSVGRLARELAERLELSPPEQDQLQLAAELHDIGKTAIPDSILNKPGELTDREWEYMRRHTLIGERIILAAPSLELIATLVRSSHERFDGNGYPDGLAGDEIPVGSRVIAVCDAFDTMVSGCVYRPAIPAADALAELRAHAGTQFDASIVETFETLAQDLQRRARDRHDLPSGPALGGDPTMSPPSPDPRS